MGIFRKKETSEDIERRTLMEELFETQEELRRARMDFNYAEEPELVESYVYELNSIEARYAYLLRRARESGTENLELFRPPKEKV